MTVNLLSATGTTVAIPPGPPEGFFEWLARAGRKYVSEARP
jgi:hypothetical protein